MNQNRLSEQIRLYRKSKGLTQAELADLLELSEMTVRRWEVGKTSPRIEEIQKIADVLEIPASNLLDSTNDSEDKSILHTKQQSNKERSLNRGMLVFETQDGKRFEAPPTDIGMKYLERMLTLSMGNAVSAGV